MKICPRCFARMQRIGNRYICLKCGFSILAEEEKMGFRPHCPRCGSVMVKIGSKYFCWRCGYTKR